MKRWINTKVVIDMDSMDVIEKQGYVYDGPIASCDPASLSSLIPLITGGMGLTGNIINGVQQGQQVKQMQNAENLSPAALASKVSSATQPLDQSLVNNVQNLVQADVASRGLAESPGTFAATESQALAPFEQQNQQTAMQLILTQLGFPAQVIAALSGKGANLTSIAQLLSKGGTLPNFPSANQVPKTPGSTTTDADLLAQITAAQTPALNPTGITAPNNWTGDTSTSSDGSYAS